MIKNLVKKLAVAATLVCTAFAGASFAACNVETDHPVVTISVEIRPGTEYARTFDLEYTLYRNLYPNTVRHFMTLASEGFYDNTLVHDYQSTDWYCGGYSYFADTYAERASANALADYFNNDSSKEDDYMTLFEGGKLDATVFSYANPDIALPTLVGEFSDNSSPEILNGKLTAEVGSLKMYYYAKETTDKVLVKYMDSELYSRDYKLNCATSLFTMQVNSGTSLSASNYCVFGKVNNLELLTEMEDAVSDSIGSDTRTVTGVYVETRESFSNEPADKNIERTFRQASEPIVIRSVKINKY